MASKREKILVGSYVFDDHCGLVAKTSKAGSNVILYRLKNGSQFDCIYIFSFVGDFYANYELTLLITFAMIGYLGMTPNNNFNDIDLARFEKSKQNAPNTFTLCGHATNKNSPKQVASGRRPFVKYKP